MLLVVLQYDFSQKVTYTLLHIVFLMLYQCKMYMEAMKMVTAGWGSPTDPEGTVPASNTEEPWKQRGGQSVQVRSLCLRTWTSPLATRPCSLTAPRPSPGCREMSPGGAHRWRGNWKCRCEFHVCFGLLSHDHVSFFYMKWLLSILACGHHLSQGWWVWTKKDFPHQVVDLSTAGSDLLLSISSPEKVM